MKKILGLFFVILLVFTLSTQAFASPLDMPSQNFNEYGIKEGKDYILDELSKSKNSNYRAQSFDGSWETFAEKYFVQTDKSWTVTFSEKFQPDEIDGIVIENEKFNTYIPIKIELFNNTNIGQIKVTPVYSYDSGTRYCLKVFLNNGNRYKMYFNTQDDENLTKVRMADFYKEKGYWNRKETPSSDSFSTNSKYVRQNKYSLTNSIVFDNNLSDEFSFLIDKNYKKLTGYYSSTDDVDNEIGSWIYIYDENDNTLLNAHPKRGDKMVYFEADLTGVEELKFKGGCYYSSIIYDETGEKKYYKGGLLYDLNLWE